MITTEVIKQLREMTGAGIMECKKALALSNSDMDAAASYLKEKGIMKAHEKESRTASEGMIHSYIHGEGRIGVLVEVNIETDFASTSERFKLFVKDIGLQIAAGNPRYIRREDIPQDVIEKIKGEFMKQGTDLGKSGSLLEKIVAGKLQKFFQETCLMDQAFIKNPDKTVKDILTEAVLSLGENIVIRRFTRYEMSKSPMENEHAVILP